MTEHEITRPIAEFALKFRGYSRRQVDAYVDATRELFEKAEARAAAAHAEATRWRDQAIELGHRIAELEQQLNTAPPRTFSAVRERLDRLLEMAEQTTSAMVATAETEAREVVTATRERAEANATETAMALIGQARDVLERAEVHRIQLLNVLAAERSQREELLAALAPLSVGLSQVLPGVAQLQESLLRSVGQLAPANEPLTPASGRLEPASEEPTPVPVKPPSASESESQPGSVPAG